MSIQTVDTVGVISREVGQPAPGPVDVHRVGTAKGAAIPPSRFACSEVQGAKHTVEIIPPLRLEADNLPRLNNDIFGIGCWVSMESGPSGTISIERDVEKRSADLPK